MALLTDVTGVASGEITTTPAAIAGNAGIRARGLPPGAADRIGRAGVPNARWIAIRLLDGDAAVEEALRPASSADWLPASKPRTQRFSRKIALQGAQ